jgi:hypothetical protein
LRPHRNPQSNFECEENWLYLANQAHLGVDDRQNDWHFNAAQLLDAGGFYNDTPYREVLWPENVRAGRVRARDEMASNAEMMKIYPALNLDKLKGGLEIPRDVKLAPFKVDYDTHEQINQKLNQTVILIKNVPFYVSQTADLGKGKFALLVQGLDGARGTVKYDDVSDCRGIAPGYFNYRGSAAWVYRTPDRQNSQGMCSRNMEYKLAGTEAVQRPRHDFLLAALVTGKDIRYGENLHDVILSGAAQSIRLNNRIALYNVNKKGAPIGVEYCGRPLGLIVNGACKVIDDCDLRPTWINKDLADVGMRMVAQ